MAFKLFLEQHDDAMLYMHTDMSGLNMGMNLMNMANAMGIPAKNVGFVQQDKYWTNEIIPENLSCLYSCMDVLANPSLGEGFGIPIIEAQACGTPVIVNDHTSMPELVGAGWTVDGDWFWHDDHDAYWKIPLVQEIVDAFELAYADRGNQELRDKAREFALGYDADFVTQEYWVPTLEKLSKPREVPALRPPGNRAQRRAKKAKA
jgi:glycosyltransferase involved in cell wall biosynthesis